MTPKPPPAYLARVRSAMIVAAVQGRDDPADTVAVALEVSLSAARHLIQLVRDLDHELR